jgi:hypothetical protein
MSSLPQYFWHNLFTGKGGFAVSFYVRLKNAAHTEAKAPTSVVMLQAIGYYLLVVHRAMPATFVLDLILASIGCKADSILSGSDHKSLLPLRISLPVTPVSSCWAS